MLGKIMKNSTSGNLYRGIHASRLVQYGRDWSFQAVLRHSSHLIVSFLSFNGAKLWNDLGLMVARIPASTSACLHPNCDKLHQS